MELFVLHTPRLEGVVANGSHALKSGLGEEKNHALRRIKPARRQKILDPTATDSDPACGIESPQRGASTLWFPILQGRQWCATPLKFDHRLER